MQPFLRLASQRCHVYEEVNSEIQHRASHMSSETVIISDDGFSTVRKSSQLKFHLEYSVVVYDRMTS